MACGERFGRKRARKASESGFAVEGRAATMRMPPPTNARIHAAPLWRRDRDDGGGATSTVGDRGRPSAASSNPT